MLVEAEIDVVHVTGFELEGQCGIMHAKTLIIDKTDMLVGSNNLSRRARERNREQCYHVCFDRPAVNKARHEFNEIYHSGVVKHDLAEDHEAPLPEELDAETHGGGALSEVSELVDGCVGLYLHSLL